MLTSEGKKATIILSISITLPTVFLSLRLAKRYRTLAVDDWLLCFALLLLYLEAIGGFFVAIKGGEGKQMSDLTPNELVWLFEGQYWYALAYAICVAAIKISVLVSYNRIFGHLNWFRSAVFTLGALTSIWFVGTFFALMLLCTPIDKTWKPMKPGHCIDSHSFVVANSISNTVLDYFILLLPVVPVWSLRMKWGQKFLVLLSFSLGSLAGVSSTMRAVWSPTVDIANDSTSIANDSDWTYIEPSAGIISACLPYLANTLGQRLLNVFKTLCAFGNRAKPVLRTGSQSERSRTHSDTPKMGNKRARDESYELNDDDHSSPEFRDKESSEDSVRNLV